jgi:L-lactate dehydrogenase complex protein LldG
MQASSSSSAREKILKRIRKALTQSTPLPFPASEGSSTVFKPSSQEMEVEFAEQFSKLLGRFIYCSDDADLVNQLAGLIEHNKWDKIYYKPEELKGSLPAALSKLPLHNHLATADIAITTCEALVARTGSIILSSALPSGRTTSVYAPIHICIAYTNQLVYDVRDGLQLIKERYRNKLPSLVTFATGPSRTADIEKTLVVGVHGPKEVYVFLVEQASPPTDPE